MSITQYLFILFSVSALLLVRLSLLSCSNLRNIAAQGSRQTSGERMNAVSDTNIMDSARHDRW